MSTVSDTNMRQLDKVALLAKEALRKHCERGFNGKASVKIVAHIKDGTISTIDEESVETGTYRVNR